MLEISLLNASHGDILAGILSTDDELHCFLSPNQKMTLISGKDYVRRCREWETKKNGKCYTVLLDKIPIGSISYVHINKTIASVGYWLRSSMWGKGYGTSMMQLFKSIVKAEGYQLLTGSIQKNNLRSKKMCEKCGAEFTEDETKYFPLFRL